MGKRRQTDWRHCIRRVFVFCFLPLLLSGCGQAPEEDASATTLRIALREGIYADVVKACLPAFEEAESVTCEVITLSEDELHNALLSNASREVSEYDVCMVDGSWTAEFYEQNLLADLSGLGYILDDDIIPATTRISYYNDSVYLAPFYGNVTVLLYNKKLLSETGFDPSKGLSLRDMLRASRKAEEAGKLGFVYRGDTPNNLVVDFLPILLSHGGWVVDQNNFPTVDTPVFKEALEYYMELTSTGKALEKQDLIASIEEGESCMAIAWPGWYTPSSDTPGDYCALSGKLETNSVAFNANVYGVWMLGVPANCAHQETAAKLVSHLMDRDVQRSTVEIGGVPCRFSSLQDPEVLELFPQYDAVRKALQGGTYRPVMKEWTAFYTILGTELGSILRGEKSMDTGLNDAQARLEQMLSSGTYESLDGR